MSPSSYLLSRILQKYVVMGSGLAGLLLFLYVETGSGQTVEYRPIYALQTIGQRFQYPLSNLDRIGIEVKRSTLPNSGDLIVRIKKSPEAEKDIVAIRVPIDSLRQGWTWFIFPPIGDDPDPNYYVQVESPGSTVENAPAAGVDHDPVPGAIGMVLINGDVHEGVLSIKLSTDRPLWKRFEYVMARFETDKPWFFNRFFYIGLFTLYAGMVLWFLRYAFRLLCRGLEEGSQSPGVPVRFSLLLTGLFVVRGLMFSALFPAWQAPDEPAHFDAIRYFAEHHRIPPWDLEIDRSVLKSMERADYSVIYRGGRPIPDRQTWYQDERASDLMGQKVLNTATALPFLSHVVASLPMTRMLHLDTTTQLFLMRIFMVLISCLIIPIALVAGRLVFPQNTALIIMVPSILCFLSMFTHISSSVSYDILTNVLAGIFFYLLIRSLHSGLAWRDMLLGGVVLGSALLTKAAAVLLVPSVFFLWLLAAWKHPDRWGMAYRVTVMLSIAACLGGWWYIYNYLEYGMAVPGMGLASPVWSKGELNADLGLTTLTQLGRDIPYTAMEEFGVMIHKAFTGLIGNFGWANVPLGSGFYILAALVISAGIVGGIIGILKADVRSTPRGGEEYKPLIMTGIVALVYIMVLFTQLGILSQGRYLFPVIIPMVCLFSWGFLNLMPPSRRAAGARVMILLVVLFDTAILLETIIPRYYLIPPPSRLLVYFF